eukprot:7270859-Prymnesium_polylepis.1
MASLAASADATAAANAGCIVCVPSTDMVMTLLYFSRASRVVVFGSREYLRRTCSSLIPYAY